MADENRLVWPTEFTRPHDGPVCDCYAQPWLLFDYRWSTDGRKVEAVLVFCENCSKEKVYDLISADNEYRVCTYRLHGWEPEPKKPRNRYHDRLPSYTPDYDRTEMRMDEDKRDWFRRVMK